jgi:RsiW-degrading membrane proteinase PrsW (M82 family)
MNVLLWSILAAAIPVLLFVGIVYWADQYEKEPVGLLLAAFVWGAVPAVLLSYFLRVVLEGPLYTAIGATNGQAVSIVILAPIIEESIKALILVGLLFNKRNEIDTLLDGVIYGAMVGLGFAFVENILYFMAQYADGGSLAWATNVVMRGWLFGFSHALFSSIIGLGIAAGRLSPRRSVKIVAPITGWLTAVSLHTLHNWGAVMGTAFCLITPLVDWGGVFLLGVIVLWSLLQEREWIRQYLVAETLSDVLTISQYETARSTRKRQTAVWKTWRQRGWQAWRREARFYHRCSELAYLKHHYQIRPTAAGQQAIDDKRNELRDLSSKL